ncbi:MAG: DEAD/DEAH box helicase family protein [Elusimicrobia bacterium]|nr:DEAD/DEAH box helicase family protein [Elusimicrobiota bacterium]
MELKKYQERVIREIKTFLETLAQEQAKGNKHAAYDACKELKFSWLYHQRENGLGKDLPTFCIKVPTGGGKTLLATQILGLAYQTILKSRNGCGLVLWVTPSDQIYKDTLKALKDRSHFYRQSLEIWLSRRIEIWEKTDVHRLTPSQLQSNLNIFLLQLASTNRESREQLKFFRDSGGNIVQHFPPEDEAEAHEKLKEKITNLDMLSDELVKTSLGNLVRLCEPPVILDEGHKATSDLARKTIEGFNASIVVELSATPPKETNVLVRVSGKELLDEEMIKLPMNISNSNQNSWEACLGQARDKREELARIAQKYFQETGQYIRPMVLVQVERTGKEQEGKGFLHSEQIKDHLIQKLGIPEAAIKIKTSEKDDIEGIELLDEECPVEWIITKAALKEGWDCPFAYILVSLNNTGSQLSMTQIVGRVLRQPYAKRTPHPELNESYVFCLRRRAADIALQVKKALEDEGYEGDLASVVDRSEEGGKPQIRETRIREEYRPLYKKFEGKVYLPRFCVKEGDQYKPLDYFRHLISQVDVSKFNYAGVDWDIADDLAAARESFYRMTLGQDELERLEEKESLILETDEKVLAWMTANLPFEYFGQREIGEIAERIYERLCAVNKDLKGRLGLVKFAIKERAVGFIQRETDLQTQKAFEELFDKKRLQFYLECKECRFEILG